MLMQMARAVAEDMWNALAISDCWLCSSSSSSDDDDDDDDAEVGLLSAAAKEEEKVAEGGWNW